MGAPSVIFTNSKAPAAASASAMEQGQQQAVVVNGRKWFPISSKTHYFITLNICAAGMLAAAILGTVWYCQNKHPTAENGESEYRRRVGIILMAVFWPLWACGCGGNLFIAKSDG